MKVIRWHSSSLPPLDTDSGGFTAPDNPVVVDDDAAPQGPSSIHKSSIAMSEFG